MKIALISPPLLLTPPSGYGGLERVVYDLGCGLVKLGHEVTLFAPPGSNIPGAKLFETIPASGVANVNWVEKELESYNKYKQDLHGGFDIIHDHTWFGFPYLENTNNAEKLKICHTHHGHCDWNPKNVPQSIGKVCMIGISKFMRDEYSASGWSSKYVYNGIDTSQYAPVYEKSDPKRLVFVGRISKLKMPHAAIRVAMANDIPIDVIGGTFVDDPAYVESIKKQCEDSGGIATIHLDVSNEEKIRIVQKACACLVPSKFGEPYGLVAAESLACGTPVIAYNDGALKEIIDRPEIGTICDDYDSFVVAVKRVATGDASYDYHKCAERADYFSRDRMAERYVKVYQEVINGNPW